jgi:hypothetical protein
LLVTRDSLTGFASVSYLTGLEVSRTGSGYLNAWLRSPEKLFRGGLATRVLDSFDHSDGRYFFADLKRTGKGPIEKVSGNQQ